MLGIPDPNRRSSSSIADQVSSSLKDPSLFSEPEPHMKDPEQQQHNNSSSSSMMADQVSSSLKNPSAFSEAETIESPETSGGSPDESSEKPEPSKAQPQQPPQDKLPSLEECLYGSKTKKSPYIPSEEDGENVDAPDTLEGGNSTHTTNPLDRGIDQSLSIDDNDELNSRWSESFELRAEYHDIDLAVLRKLCSYGSGIPEYEGRRADESSSHDNDADNDDGDWDDLDPGVSTRGTYHRGVAWRVLLEQLPIRDIHATWPKTLPTQRNLYRELVEKYLEDAVDPGRLLKGESHWQQSLKISDDSSRELPKAHQSEESGSNADETDAGAATPRNEDDKEATPETVKPAKPDSESSLEVPPFPRTHDRKVVSDSVVMLDSSNHSCNSLTEDIYDAFPPHSKYKELWHKAGITLIHGHSAAALGMNRLRIPKELLAEDTDGEETSKNDDSNDKDGEAGESAVSRTKKDDLFERFCKDAKLLSEIRKDVVRTQPHLRFYLEPRDNLGIRRHAAMERVLFVWAKLNGNLYVQGMNEIVGTIYYVLANDPTSSSSSKKKDDSGSKRKQRHYWADHAEADSYFLFNVLMTNMDIRDVFVADLDHDSVTGLHARINNIEMLLQKHDPEMFKHLKSLGLDSSFYAIRWLTTLLSREFRLPDTIRLWDSMFASTNKENFLRYVCATMVMAIRDRLFRGDFGTSLKLLQNYPSGEIGMDELLESSRALWIYEMQISVACQKGGIPLRKALKLIAPPDSVIMAFGRHGGRSRRISEPVMGTIKNVAASTTSAAVAAVAANNNVGKIVGRAKNLWRWGSPTKTTKKEISENVVESVAEKKEDNGQNDEWDIIDSIIDGEKEFVNGKVSSSNKASTTAEVSETKSNSSLPSYDSVQSNNDSAEYITPDTTPTASPSRASRIWNRMRDSGNATPNAAITNQSHVNESVVNDILNDDGPVDPIEAKEAGQNGGFWNRFRDNSATTNNNNNESYGDGQADIVEDFSNSPIRKSEHRETTTNAGFWNRMRRSL